MQHRKAALASPRCSIGLSFQQFTSGGRSDAGRVRIPIYTRNVAAISRCFYATAINGDVRPHVNVKEISPRDRAAGPGNPLTITCEPGKTEARPRAIRGLPVWNHLGELATRTCPATGLAGRNTTGANRLIRCFLCSWTERRLPPSGRSFLGVGAESSRSVAAHSYVAGCVVYVGFYRRRATEPTGTAQV